LERSLANERAVPRASVASAAAVRGTRIEQAVATLAPEPAHANMVTTTTDSRGTSAPAAEPGHDAVASLAVAEVASNGGGEVGVAAEPAAKTRSKRGKLNRKSKRAHAVAADAAEAPAPPPVPVEAQAAPEEATMSPAERAGLGTTVPF
jgi:hypothetical protein